MRKQKVMKAHKYMDDEVIQKKVSPIPGTRKKKEMNSETANLECLGK